MAVIRMHRVHELPTSTPDQAPADSRPVAEPVAIRFERWTERGRRASVTR